TLAFALIFALCLAITLWAIFALSDVQDKIDFLEIADSYTSEILEARRYEKNFLLYGTNLEDAIEHLSHAEALLQEDVSRARKVMGDTALTTMTRLATQYRTELQRLGEMRDEAVKKGVEAELRRSGAQMVSLAQEFRAKEREAVDRMLTLARRIAFLFLGTVLTLMVFIGAFLARQILSALRRFTNYTERIGAGDFRPILPTRKYRDEFSQLALALNRMTRELDHRERILVESHKLRAIGTLVAGVAHELNNPLNNVMLTAAMMEESHNTLSESERLEMVRDIITQTERSQRIVRNLLDFARESETKLEPLDLGAIVDEAVQLVANQVRMLKAHLIVHAPDKLAPVHGDRQMLCQVFVNLIVNALDVCRPQGRIEISVHPDMEEGFLAVDVKD
ncbi:MAG TPA: HAMP domain-containing sensor histidine kinase, partial [Candidatus Methylomirabilis sp.]|nr:HAMP domain-containing sensor histidine kinase [Candidatus Methylomirabilis sp.]